MKQTTTMNLKPEVLQALRKRKEEVGVPISVQIEKMVEAREAENNGSA